MDTLELEVVEIATNTETIVEIDSTLPEVTVDITKSISAEIQPDTYVLTSDGMYTGNMTGSIPKWLIDAMQTLLTTGTGNITDTIQGLRDMISLLEVGVNQNKTSILTTNESFNALETSVVSRLNANEAAIYDVYTTKVDATSATAIAAQVVSSTFGGNADAYIANIARAYTDAGSATALSIEQLYAEYNNVAVNITALDEVVVKQANVYSQPDDPSLDVLITLKIGDYWIDTDHPTRQGYQWNGVSWDLVSDDAISKAVVWSANSSKLITDPNGNITGWAMSDSSTAASEFTIYAENFKITDGTTGYTPFQVNNGTVYIGEVDTSTPQITSIGSYASAPVATAVNQVYKNTTNGNTYIWNGSSWVLWLAKGEQGIQGLTGPTGATGATGATGLRGAVSVFKTYASNPTTTDLTNAIYEVVDPDSLRNGDNVTYTISGTGGGTKMAYYMNGWITNIALYVNGDAVITGTLAASRITAGHIGTAVTATATNFIAATATFASAITTSATLIGSLKYTNSANTAVKVLITANGRTGITSGDYSTGAVVFGLFNGSTVVMDYGWTPAGQDSKSLSATATIPANSSTTFYLRGAKDTATAGLYTIGCNMMINCIGVSSGA